MLYCAFKICEHEFDIPREIIDHYNYLWINGLEVFLKHARYMIKQLIELKNNQNA